MKNWLYTISYLFICLYIFPGCREEYHPPITDVNNSYLVVEGTIINGSDSTIISLSRLRKLIDTASNIPVSGLVWVEGENGQRYTLSEFSKGRFAIAALPLNTNVKYRLHIRTTDNREYFSDYVAVKETPAIDSLTWKEEPAGVRIFVNTHDPLNQARYYRWAFDETWEYYSHFTSSLEYRNNTIVNRPFSNYIDHCWSLRSSKNILVASSAQLSQDVINQFPLHLIPANGLELTVRYSINVKQYALTREAFLYWQLLKKNTEQLGGLFDAQPSQITGNIHAADNPAEPVIGYVSVASVKQQRIFIRHEELTNWHYPSACTAIIIPPDELQTFLLDYVPITFAYNIDGVFLGYYASSSRCVDCRKTGGSTNKPSYW